MKKTGLILISISIFLVAQSSAQVTHFQAILSEDFVILGGVQGTGSNAVGIADFTLTQVPGNPSENTLTYDIRLQNVDLDGAQTPSVLDDITAMHLHDTTVCSPAFPQCIEGTDTAGTIHLLNIFGLPRNDDADVMVDAMAGKITGVWDDSDTSAPGTVAPTLSIADPDVLDVLLNEEAAIFVHTNEIPSAATGGMLRIVPEPGTLSLFIPGMLLLFATRRRL